MLRPSRSGFAVDAALVSIVKKDGCQVSRLGRQALRQSSGLELRSQLATVRWGGSAGTR